MSFEQRLQALPHLGLGVSTEYGAHRSEGALQPVEMHRQHPGLVRFIEMGVETAKGLDEAAEAWLAHALPTTYHFLDINLHEPEDFDAAWLSQVRALAERIRPAWICGDAGLWHFGARDRGQMLLLPPILTAESARDTAEGVRRLRDETGFEVFPENPPGNFFLGDLHILEFFARVAEQADTGLLLDCAHLAIFQRMTGRDPLDGLGDFPLERVVEVHVAGGSERVSAEGYAFVEDDHSTAVLDDTWQIFEHVAQRATGLRAVVFECERNPSGAVLPGFERIRSICASHRPELVS